MTGHRRRARRVAATRAARTSLALAGAALALTACGSSSAAVMAKVGTLQIRDAYIPQPASPSVAALYLTIANAGSTADRLTAVSTPAAGSTMLMQEVDQGGSGTMANLASLAIPAHGTAMLAPGGDHGMLMNPTPLRSGQHVSVSLTFAHAGTVTFQVPIVPMDRALQGSGGGMGNMPGM